MRREVSQDSDMTVEKAHPMETHTTLRPAEGAPEAEGEEEELYIADGDFMDGDDEDIDFVSHDDGQDSEARKFDQIVGALSDILLDPEFEEVREGFCREHCKHFEEGPENKLVYTDVFTRYTELIEAAIEQRLSQAVEGFSMQAFLQMLAGRRDELMTDVFDLLLSLGDFETFKELMLSYKREVDGAGPGLQIQCHALRIHVEEQEDGDERPDLDHSLTISPVGCAANKLQRTALV